jgi:calcium/calmodulin-dependent protein kinase kinase 2
MSSIPDNCEQSGHAGDISKKEAGAGILPSHGNSNTCANLGYPLISTSQAFPWTFQGKQRMDDPLWFSICKGSIKSEKQLYDSDYSRSTPAYQSPLRHHRRGASQHREVKETLDARSEYTNNEKDGKAEHHINQYLIKDEIGRGSFGAVHVAVDQYGKEYVRSPGDYSRKYMELIIYH